MGGVHTMNLQSLWQMQGWFARLEGFIRAAVARAQATDISPNDALRGLIITDAEVENHLERGPLAGFWADEAEIPSLFDTTTPEIDAQTPLGRLAVIFQLTPLDIAILLLAAAPEFDRRYERLYAYLQDDVSQKRPTVNLMMNLLGMNAEERFAVRARLDAHQPLRQMTLLDCVPENANASFLAHYLRVDARIINALLGDETPDTRLKGAVSRLMPDGVAIDIDDATANAIRSGIAESMLIYLRGVEGVGRREIAAALCADEALPLIGVDAAQMAAAEIFWPLALREGYLAEAALLIHHWESGLEEDSGQPAPELWSALLKYPYPVFLCGKTAWEPLDTMRSRRMMRLSFELPSFPDRQRLWAQALTAQGIKLDVESVAVKFRFTPMQIARAANTAADLAASRGEAVNAQDLLAGAQAHSSLKLGRLAKQVTPRHSWDDLILPPDRIQQLRELRMRAEHAHIVSDAWGFRRKIAPRPGISALFAGESGTGKTMSAEVIATDLGLVMYRIDLSSVVSKYIGETEKNLSVIFEEAHASNAILFFDEADALFGKRSEVKDAHDRYANIETAYLLQQIEDYDGIAILATNLRQNLDEAFTRRLDFVIDFPFPEAEYRKRIWEVHFPTDAPLAPEVDLGDLAERYPLAGGNIRNAVLASAYLAAADGRVITMQHIRHAIRREHQKMGRLVD